MINLHNKDCFEVMAEIKTGSVDMILTDPPYYSTNLKFDQAPRLDFALWLKECQRILKPHGVLVSFADFNLLADLRSKSPFKSTYELIWHKTMAVGFLDANRRPLRSHEFIGVFMDGMNKATYNPQKTAGEPYVKKNSNHTTTIYSTATAKGNYIRESNGDRQPHSIIKSSNSNNKSVHPTQKPIQLCDWLIKTYSNEGETIFDGFMGSGSSGVAALNNGRKFVGCELAPTYFDIAKQRLDNATLDLMSYAREAC